MVKTLTAMANTDCTKNVYIIIGIADNENAVKDFENHYNVHCVTINRSYVGNSYSPNCMQKSKSKTGNGKEREIIDGLQRLDAIFSFIKQEFPVKWEGKEYYCNKDALFCTSEVFEQNYPVLDFDFCMQFGEYELPT